MKYLSFSCSIGVLRQISKKEAQYIHSIGGNVYAFASNVFPKKNEKISNILDIKSDFDITCESFKKENCTSNKTGKYLRFYRLL